MGKRPNTQSKKERFSWHVYLDKDVKTSAKIAAAAAKIEVRELISDIVREKLFGVKSNGV